MFEYFVLSWGTVWEGCGTFRGEVILEAMCHWDWILKPYGQAPLPSHMMLPEGGRSVMNQLLVLSTVLPLPAAMASPTVMDCITLKL